jgi:sterol 3beta-glucosyltransferase
MDGQGTTSAGLRAGIPNIVIAFTADEPFWGRRVHSISAGPIPIHVKKLSGERLSNAIFEAENQLLQKSANAMGQKLREGVGQSITGLKDTLTSFLDHDYEVLTVSVVLSRRSKC